jgi:hypothetical protein
MPRRTLGRASQSGVGHVLGRGADAAEFRMLAVAVELLADLRRFQVDPADHAR